MTLQGFGRWAAVALCLAAPAAYAHEVRHGKLSIAHPFVVLDAACKAGPLRAYVMLVVNEGAQADRLVGAELKGGVQGRLVKPGAPSRPVPPEGVEVPAGGRAAVMAPDLALEFPPLKALAPEGGMVQGALKFARAGTVPVKFMVEASHRSADGRAPPCAAEPPKHQH